MIPEYIHVDNIVMFIFLRIFPTITNVYIFSLLAVCPGILWCVCVFVCLMYSSCDTWPQTDRVCLEGERVFDGWD